MGHNIQVNNNKDSLKIIYLVKLLYLSTQIINRPISLKSIDLYFENMNAIITSAKNMSIQSPFRITISIRNDETTKYSTLQAPHKSYRVYEKSKTLENKNHIGVDALNRYKNYAGLVEAGNIRLKCDSDSEKNEPQEILHQMLMSMESIAPNNM